MEERLQKIIARAGIASRRRAEEMISSGLVTVNGQTVTELGTKADIGRDHIKVAGKLLRSEAESAHVYLILNKPTEVVATMSDPEGRPSLRDFLHGVPERVFPVGRLEYHSSGLVFLTNDGDLANQMLKTRNLPQVYQFKVKSLLTFAEIAELSRATGARLTRMVGKEMPWYLVTLSDARRDQLRDRLFRSAHPVEKIRRVGLGGIEVGSLAPGRYRALSAEELSNLRRAVAPGAKMAPATAAASPPKPAAQQNKARHRPNFGRSGSSRSKPSFPPKGRRSMGRPNAGRPSGGAPNTGRPSTGRPNAGRPNKGRPNTNAGRHKPSRPKPRR
jgi:23S rRNA pseudouridine2605 synthase